MIPILFPSDATEFNTRGLGALSDAISCTVVEERNSIYELEMTYPKDGIHFSDILLDRIIYAIPSPYRLPQPFRIYKISTPMRGAVTINAQHISYDLSGVTVMPFTGESVADIFNQIPQKSVNENKFKFSGGSDFTSKCIYSTPNSARQILGGMTGSIIDIFGGEYEFDGFNVRWYLNRGTDSGVTIRYGKNLLDIAQDVDVSGVISGVVPYWSDTDGVNVVVGDVIKMDGEFEFDKIIPLDMSESFENAPTKEQLEARAKTFIKSNYSIEPELNCDVSFALIEQSEEYKEFRLLEKCDLCDTITVVYPELKVNSTAKIVKIETDVLRGRYNSVTIGTVRANIAQTIVAQANKTDDLPTKQGVSEFVKNALSKITGADGGSVRLLDTNDDGEPDTLYIADNPDPTKAVRVWRFNYLGWAASKNGYNGPFTLGATLEDGLLAEFVTAANLVAGTIKSADDGDTFYLDLDNGILRMNASSFTVLGQTIEDVLNVDIGDIGVTNLLLNSKTMANYRTTQSTTIAVGDDGFGVATMPESSSDQWKSVVTQPTMLYSDFRDKEVTVSFDVRSDQYQQINSDTSRGLSVAFNLYDGESTTRGLYKANSMYTQQITNEWTRVSLTRTLTDSFFSSGSGTINENTRLAVVIYDYSIYSMQVRKLKLTFGKMSSDWSPAPEDFDQSLNDLNLRMSSELSVVADQIQGKVSKGDLETYLRLREDGVHVGRSDSDVEAFVNSTGSFDITENGITMSSFGSKRQKIGNLVIFETAHGDTAFIKYRG